MVRLTKTLVAVAAACVLVGLTAAASAGTGRDDNVDEGGGGVHVDFGAWYPSVGYVQAPQGRASATLIDPQWALTAAHVVDGATSLSFTIGGIEHGATQWLPHPKWNGDLEKGYDIGLIQFGDPISDIEPAPLYTGTSELDSVGTAAGYGRYGTGTEGATGFDGQRRAGNNTIDALLRTPGKDNRILLTDFDSGSPADNALADVGSEPEPLALEYLIAPGDSGGGLFLDTDESNAEDINGDGVLDPVGDVLAGVHSFVWGRLDGAPDSDYGDVSGHTRVSAFGDWIDSVLSPGGGDDDGGKPPWAGGPGGKPKKSSAFDDSIVPEPATLALLLSGGLMLMWRRRASRSA